jgi:uncharacterized membrane protein
MARDMKDAGDTIGSALGTIAREVAQSVQSNGHKKGLTNKKGLTSLTNGGDGALSGMRGVAAGAAAAAAAPLAGRALKSALGGKSGGVTNKVADSAKGAVSKGVKGAAEKQIDRVSGAPGMAKEAGKKMIPGVGGEGKEDRGAPGVGKGRRMPVQQAADIGVPLSVAYNQWTQFEEWPQFMHRLDQATQEDDSTVSFKTKVWGMSKEFVAEIDEQRPDERIKWSVKEGVTHSGVVTFHELGPRLTRVQVSLDVEPGSLIEKAARGMRHVKRAVRADLSRFKAFIEMRGEETGAWRGTIKDGDVVKRSSGSRSSGSSKPRKRGSAGTRKRGAAKTRKRGSAKTRKRGSAKRSTGPSARKRTSPSSSSSRRGSSRGSSSSRSSGSSRKRSSSR